LLRRLVLIPPIAIGEPDWDGRVLPVSITKDQVRNCPHIDTNKPVSRQYEMMNLGYYGYTYYWEREQAALRATREPEGDPHLRSCKAILDYRIAASDGEIGHVQSLLVDDGSWIIRYLVINTSNWGFGHHLLVSPEWVTEVSWAERTLTLDLDIALVKSAPQYDPGEPLARKQEVHLYQHFQRSPYWNYEVERAPREPGREDGRGV
jgi:hypothetical protein